MDIYELFITVGLPLVAVLSLVMVVAKIRSMARLQNILDESIILVPLHKSNTPLCLAIVFTSVLGGLSLTATILSITRLVSAIAYASLTVVCACMVVLLVSMMRFRMAVTESGVLVAYRFMNWESIYDYELGGGEIFFTANRYGQPSIAYTTPILRFSEYDQDKLKHLLDTNVNIGK